MVSEIKDFEQRKENLIKKGKELGFITYEELAEELKGLEIGSDLLDELYNALMENDISVVSESDLDDGSELRYMDTRKFGKMYLIKKEDIDKIGPLVKLGLEPWDDNLTSEYLLDKYKKKKLPIKSVLLDQNIIVGIGNIYADEILFLSKINPLKKCNLITKEEAENIIKYTKKVLEAAIEKGGTTIRTYSSVDGVHGLFQNELFVHGKDKNNCPICNTKIEKIKVGGRGTYYCPKCQTLQ